jgi:hypothetical protein
MPLDPILRTQFVSATYSVRGLADMRIGEPLSEEVQAWLRAYQSDAIAVLGAENPQGRRITDEENEYRHLELLKELQQRGLHWYPATGKANDWEERHVMILGLSRNDTIDLKQRYDQAAALYAQMGGVVELIED